MNEQQLISQPQGTGSPAPAIAAAARESSRRDWLRHTGSLAGLALTAGLAGRAFADNTSPTPPGAGTATTGNTTDTVNTPAAMPQMEMDGAGASTHMTATPGDDQAMPQNSIVTSIKHNPNNPALTIPAAGKSPVQSDVDILNFALGLEYLEADFYASIVAAQQAHPYLPDAVAQAANVLAIDEAAHVAALLQVLTLGKATPITKPTFVFPPEVYVSSVAFLNLAQTFEVTGTGAYLGAAPMVKSRNVLKFAASIYGIEARHTGWIRLLNGAVIAPTETEIPLTMAEVQSRVAPFIKMTT